MFVVMASGASEAEILGVKGRILAEGLTPFDHAGSDHVVIAVVGEIGGRRPVLLDRFAALPGVERVTPISRPFKLTSREFHPEDTVIRVLDASIGDGSLTVMAGPCSVESRDQLFETADAVKAAGATILRGGAFKPRTSPYAFQGLGVEALRYLAEARDRTGLPVITEVMEPSQVDIVAEYADILQIGTRNMQNYSLLRDVGRVARPVMLKRGYGATVEEWLMAAEYIVSSGNPNVILCERGIRTFETYTRNTMDLAAVPLVHHLSHLPVIVDPSHATGKRWLVKPLAIGGVAVGADGVMVEVHPHPDDALSDAEQQLDLDQFRDLMSALGPVHEHVRSLHGDLLPLGDRGQRRRTGQALTRTDAPAMPADVAEVRPARRLRGSLRLPGDKSVSHRALILAALAPGSSRITGAGDGADVRSTAGIVRALGATVERLDGDGPTVDYRVTSRGADGLAVPEGPLDCGNSGTSLRLLAGMLAGLPLTATLDGDDSLRRRPVARIIEPLRAMGASLSARDHDTLPPLVVTGRTPLDAIDYTTPVPSAQVKSAILLAGTRASGRTTVRESVATRDHTERMLRARGIGVASEIGRDGGATVTVHGGQAMQPIDERVPGDVSAAAFWLVAAAIHPDAELTLHRCRRQPDPAGRPGPAAPHGRRHRRALPDRPRRRHRRTAGRPDRPLVAAARDRPVPARRRGRDRRDPDPVPGRRPGPWPDDDPWRGRTPPQGVGSDRGHRGRTRGPRGAGGRRRRRPAHRTATPRSPARRRTASTTIGWR